jgi:hypothetical protein
MTSERSGWDFRKSCWSVGSSAEYAFSNHRQICTRLSGLFVPIRRQYSFRKLLRAALLRHQNTVIDGQTICSPRPERIVINLRLERQFQHAQ